MRMDCLEIPENFDAVLDGMESSESIRIERDGRVAARLVPYGPDEVEADQDNGSCRLPSCRLSDWAFSGGSERLRGAARLVDRRTDTLEPGP